MKLIHPFLDASLSWIFLTNEKIQFEVNIIFVNARRDENETNNIKCSFFQEI
jgi:hypothetical protein